MVGSPPISILRLENREPMLQGMFSCLGSALVLGWGNWTDLGRKDISEGTTGFFLASRDISWMYSVYLHEHM